MPTYLVHGFRWARGAIRIHIALYDLDDAAAEWIVAPASAITLLNSFYTLYDFLPPSQSPVVPTPSSTPTSPGIVPLPKSPVPSKSPGPKSPGPKSPVLKSPGLAKVSRGERSHAGTRKNSATAPQKFNDWSAVKLLEQYDPDDESIASQPFAYVADFVVPVSLSVDIAAEMAMYEERQRAEAQPVLSPELSQGAPPPNGDSTSATGSNGTSGNLGGGAASTGLSERDLRRKSRRLGWFEKLRDQLQKEATIGWYVVVCGDEERDISGLAGPTEDADDETGPKTPRSAGLRGFFGKRERSSKTDNL
jgi:hypothetical protein